MKKRPQNVRKIYALVMILTCLQQVLVIEVKIMMQDLRIYLPMMILRIPHTHASSNQLLRMMISKIRHKDVYSSKSAPTVLRLRYPKIS